MKGTSFNFTSSRQTDYLFHYAVVASCTCTFFSHSIKKIREEKFLYGGLFLTTGDISWKNIWHIHLYLRDDNILITLGNYCTIWKRSRLEKFLKKFFSTNTNIFALISNISRISKEIFTYQTNFLIPLFILSSLTSQTRTLIYRSARKQEKAKKDKKSDSFHHINVHMNVSPRATKRRTTTNFATHRPYTILPYIFPFLRFISRL